MIKKNQTNTTFDEGANIDPKIPDEDEDSLEPKSSEVKEEDDPICLLPSIFSVISTQNPPPLLSLYIPQSLKGKVIYVCLFEATVKKKPTKKKIKLKEQTVIRFGLLRNKQKARETKITPPRKKKYRETRERWHKYEKPLLSKNPIYKAFLLTQNSKFLSSLSVIFSFSFSFGRRALLFSLSLFIINIINIFFFFG